jgi:hypothetical protein
MRKSATEHDYKFELKQNYNSLIHRAVSENKSMKAKPGLIAGFILFLIPVLAKGDYGYDREIFWFFLILAVGVFFYLKQSYKHKIQLNDELIPIWEKNAELQEKYANYLYQLEEENEIKTGNRFTP